MEFEEAMDGKGQLVPFKDDFRIHGFDLYWDDVDPMELTFMFVNHQRSGNGISIFKHKIGSNYIQHVKTVKSPLLYLPNDVVATSRTTFYATNELKYARGILRKFEVLLGMPWGHVVHYGYTGVFTKAYDGIAYANGIAKSPDGSIIYVAASSEPSVNMFRPKSDGTLELISKNVFRGFVPDNISVDGATGHVLVAASIRRLIPAKNLRKGFIEEGVLNHDGRLLPSTTVAVVQRRGNTKRILLGSVMADHIAICNAGSRRTKASLV
ncbi:hypothetical protein LPJ81_002528 [Coemansia sp. IMI 209127]|nr:hypothetical protein LPJ81_002528 [Coemansia sp. IMI 209127]